MEVWIARGVLQVRGVEVWSSVARDPRYRCSDVGEGRYGRWRCAAGVSTRKYGGIELCSSRGGLQACRRAGMEVGTAGGGLQTCKHRNITMCKALEAGCWRVDVEACSSGAPESRCWQTCRYGALQL